MIERLLCVLETRNFGPLEGLLLALVGVKCGFWPFCANGGERCLSSNPSLSGLPALYHPSSISS